MAELEEINNLFSTPKNIVVLSHRNPDGDAIGSALGVYHVLKKMLHHVQIILPSEFPPNFSFLSCSSDILIYDLQPERSIEFIKSSDIVFCLDFNDLSRVDKMGEALALASSKIIMIDHHLYPLPFADLCISDPQMSSTAELVYQTLKDWNWSKYFDKDFFEAILTGIITDTGSFKYNVNAMTFQRASEMMRSGADLPYIQDRIFNQEDIKSLQLLGHCLNKRMKIIDDCKTGFIYLTKGDFIQFNIQRGDTEGIVNHLLRLENVNVAGLITEQPNIIKFSLRSKGDFSVERMAKDYFNGGGHKNAAGGFLHGSLNQSIQLFENAILNNKFEIINSY